MSQINLREVHKRCGIETEGKPDTPCQSAFELQAREAAFCVPHAQLQLNPWWAHAAQLPPFGWRRQRVQPWPWNGCGGSLSSQLTVAGVGHGTPPCLQDSTELELRPVRGERRHWSLVPSRFRAFSRVRESTNFSVRCEAEIHSWTPRRESVPSPQYIRCRRDAEAEPPGGACA